MDSKTEAYLKTRITGLPIFANSGEIVTTCTLTLDNGEIMSGTATRDISIFDTNEAQAAAFENAVSTLVPGIALFLDKIA